MEHIAKNEIVHPRSRYPAPQPCVPCHRLPFSVHQYICDELDSDEEWTRLAEVALDDCCKEDIEGRLNTESIPHQSPTTLVLDELWKKSDGDMTVEKLQKLFKWNTISPQVEDKLTEFLEGRTPVDKSLGESSGSLKRMPCTTLPEDPRREVSIFSDTRTVIHQIADITYRREKLIEHLIQTAPAQKSI